MFDGWGISCEIALIWMSLDFTDDQSTLVQVMALCRQATSHYLNQCWHRPMSPYGVTRPQWVNSLWPTDVIRWHWAGSPLAQVMACCLMAPSHCLNQCYLPSVMSNDIHLRAISQEIPQPSITKISFRITYLIFHLNLPGANELMRHDTENGPEHYKKPPHPSPIFEAFSLLLQ